MRCWSLGVVGWLLFVRCLLLVVCGVLFCMLLVCCCLLFVVRCLCLCVVVCASIYGVCRSLFVVCCVLFGDLYVGICCLLSFGRCVSFVVWRTLLVACCFLLLASCVLLVACCVMRCGCRSLCVFVCCR